MSDLISNLASALGVPAQTAESAAGAIFGALHKAAPAGALDELLKHAPEVASWISKAPSAAGGGLLEAASGALGGSGGGLLGGLASAAQGVAAVEAIAAMLQKAGVPPSLTEKVLPLVIGFVKDKLGAEGFAQLAQKVPMLNELAGAAEGGVAGALSGALGGLFR